MGDRISVTDDTIRHAALPRSEVAILQPVVTVEVDGEIPTGLRFAPDKVLVVRKNAAIDTFTRPLPKRVAASMVAATAAGMDRSRQVGARTMNRLPVEMRRQQLPPLNLTATTAVKGGPSSMATTPTTPRHAVGGANGKSGITA